MMDAEHVAERIRDDVRRRRAQLLPLASDIQAIADVALLEATHDVYNVELSSPRRLLGPLLNALKRAARRLLAPSLARQIEFNATVARLARHTAGQAAALAERQDELRRLLATQAEEIRALRREPP